MTSLRTRTSDNDSTYSARADHRHHHHGALGLAEEIQHQLSCLPPVDTGKHAYLFLLACFVLSALVWSYGFCFGILSDYYARTEPFKGSSAIANIGTCCSGLMYLGGFPALVLNRMYPRWARYSPLIGLLILCGGLCVSAWATNVTQLIITQGVVYGIGGAIAYTPCTMYIDEWFVKRKGLAYGIMWSGTSLAGVVLPLILERLLESYGYQTTIIIWSVVLFGITAPLAWYIKPRIPPLPVRSLRAFNLRFSLSRRFILYQISNTIEAIGFYIPGIYVPIYAGDVLGASEFASSVCILIFNTSAVVGCVAIGWLIDRFHVTTCVMVSTIGATLGTFLLWGCAESMPMVYIYCVSYGLSAGSFSTTWTGVMREVSGKDMLTTPSTSSSVDPVMVFVLLAAGRGIGNVVSGPMSQAMYHAMPWKGEAGMAYGSGFGSLIVFTGLTALGSGICFLGRRVGWC
ncbi:major facilitator superfamily domain-containing protein [Coniella lustricola]|uniref:Major facilitator superfamily domain-containing protein n=1 Tax=Coniella lustricola TaxID=2025994 RepID=A0A2T3AFA6_9PEZI|nr:major facilitator superfamily domain-containing protein [Coniella lustricola]